MEPSLYMVLGIVVTEGAALAALWIKMSSTRRRTLENGYDITVTGAGLQSLATRIVHLEAELVRMGQERDAWQLRALSCEERERRSGEA